MIKCPICSDYIFERANDFDVCPFCEWENDGVQLEDPNYSGGANDLCLNDFKRKWKHSNMSIPLKKEAHIV